MCTSCGKKATNRRDSKRRVVSLSTPALSKPLSDSVSVKYIGSDPDILYGVVSGNRYIVEPGWEILVDKADLNTGIPHRPGLLENGLFVLA